MDHIPRLYFANLPTPLEAMPRLTKALGGPQLFVKRDDLTGLALGGNKTRKLEFLLAEAQTHAARTLITAGAIQSNHCRQTAAAATRFGLDCILVLSGEKPATLSGNLLLDQMLGAEVVWSERETRDRVLQEVFQQAETAGRRPFLIPYGGSSPTGAMGYAVAMQELIEQIEGYDVLKAPPDWIVFPSSSGGTQAGLVAGARLTGYRGKILGISVDEPGNVLKERVASLASATAASLGQMFTFEPEEILVDDNYLGGGYGVMGEAEKEALSLFARSEGLLLDPVYTGRAAAGMLDLVRQGYFPSDQTVLFWHTGGTPALFADRYRPN
jgi:D-cysteine desulfhydrase family pyridoxal phosphate-dependent enzyme